MNYKTPPPPYESFLEEAFAQQIEKYLKPEITLEEQHEVETICGNFRFDFVVEHDSKIIAFEIDGQNYHDENTAIYDFWRDSVLLAENHAQSIFRLAGPVLKQKMEDCVFLLAHFLPGIFDSQSILNLEKQIDQEIREQVINYAPKTTSQNNRFIKINFRTENPSESDPAEEIPWISLKSESFEDERHRRIYRFIKMNPGRRLNPIIYKFHKTHNNFGI